MNEIKIIHRKIIIEDTKKTEKKQTNRNNAKCKINKSKQRKAASPSILYRLHSTQKKKKTEKTTTTTHTDSKMSN